MMTPHGTTRTRFVLVATAVLLGASCASDDAPDGEGAEADTVGASTSVVVDTAATNPSSSSPPSVDSAETTTSVPPTTAPAQPSLAWRTVDLVDTTRPSVEVLADDGSVAFEASDSRSIPTVILYPGADGGGQDAAVADGSVLPLVVYLKGFGGFNGPADPLLVRLAEDGYIVAAPNIREVSEPVNHVPGYVEQPGDARFVIDALTNPSDGFFDELAAVIDPMGVGLVAHSIGGAGAFGLAYHDCCRDDRVDAVVAFGANTNFALGESDFEFAGTPLLLVHGEADDIAPVELGTTILEVAQPPSHLLTLPGADHFEPVYGDREGGDGDRAAATAASVVAGFLDLHVASTTSPDEFDALTSSLEPGMWTDAGS
jgi:pimeloyl-ACP methyl ester carboxylesterase